MQPMRQLYVITHQSPPRGRQVPEFSIIAGLCLFIVCLTLTYILEVMSLSWICTELILKNMEQSSERLATLQSR